jgi:NAD(P)-dependent dehydrogenase (short-subunit alcohol dehydrogenase family)
VRGGGGFCSHLLFSFVVFENAHDSFTVPFFLLFHSFVSLVFREISGPFLHPAYLLPPAAPFLLTLGLLPHLREGARQRPEFGARIIHVSSKLHELGSLHTSDPDLRQGYSPLAAYAQSKLAQVAFSAELRERLPREWNVQTYSLHPGASRFVFFSSRIFFICLFVFLGEI